MRNEISSSKEQRNSSPVMQYCQKTEEYASDCCTLMQKSGQGRAALRNEILFVAMVR